MECQSKDLDIYKGMYESKILKIIFPFIYEGKRKILDLVAFVLLIWFILIPGIAIIAKFKYYLPKFIYANVQLSLAAQFKFVTLLMSILILWYLMGMFFYALAKSTFGSTTKAQVKQFIKRYLWQIMFLVLFVWVYISTLQASDSKIAFMGTTYRMEGFYTICRYVCIFVCVLLVKDTKKKRAALICFSIVSLAVAFLMMGQRLRWTWLTQTYYNSAIVGIFQNSNHAAYYITAALLVMAGWLGAAKKWYKCVVFGVVFAFEFWVIIQNNTLGAYVAIILACAIGLWFFTVGFQISILKAAIPLLLCVIVSFSVGINPNSKYGSPNVKDNISSLCADFKKIFAKIESDVSLPVTTAGTVDAQENVPPPPPSDAELDRIGTNRMGLWRWAMKFIAKRPIFGYGPEQLGELYYQHTDLAHPTDRPHNEYLQCAAFYGIPALILYLGGLVVIFKRQLKQIKQLEPFVVVAACGVMGYLISAFFGVTMYYTFPYFLILLALAVTPPTKMALEKTAQGLCP